MRVRLYRIPLQLTSAVSAAHERHEWRDHLFLLVEDNRCWGLGEISPQPHLLNGDPSTDEVLVALSHVMSTLIMPVVSREGRWPTSVRLSQMSSGRRADAFAIAIVEMALLDYELRDQGHAIDSWWPPLHEPRTIVSAPDDETSFVGVVDLWRVKVTDQIRPTSWWQSLNSHCHDVVLDFNASAASREAVHAQIAIANERLNVVAVEQPFAPGDLVAHAALARELDCIVSIDEGVRTRRDVDDIARYDAASMICVKPARVGGYAQARTIITHAREIGLRPYVGGFFESPLARRLNRALAQALVDEPSDIAQVAFRGPSPLTVVGDGLGFRLQGLTDPVCEWGRGES